HGATGTGKELFAQAIHNAGPRKDKPFVVINCGAIPRELLESELFGYMEGAFTGAQKGGRPGKFELADGGTLFLDEIGDMPMDMQVKILRALQSGEIYRVGGSYPIMVDLRVISATNVDLERAIIRGDFRQDLFYRISTFRIDIPPLDQRDGDVRKLARAFLTRIRRLVNKPDLTFSDQALSEITNRSWPGNIRQLENMVERAVNIASHDKIQVEDLGLGDAEEQPFLPEKETLLKNMEKQMIQRLMEKHKGNVSKVARLLGISRPTLYRKLDLHGLREKTG
ncbi:MAG: sigma 54-interacting transcriptional regulator, partial [Desulfobacterales bacterium]|nr:sigma 54-interacting transcriptional regulator [Desulfobacterales bacterium]